MLTIALIPTRATVKFSFNGRARIDIFIAMLKIELSDFSSNKGSSLISPLKIFEELTDLISKSSVRLHELKAPSLFSAYSPENILLLGSYNSFTSLIIAYLSSNTEKLTVDDGAISIGENPDTKVSIRISFKTEIFYILRTVFRIAAASASAKKGLNNGTNKNERYN